MKMKLETYYRILKHDPEGKLVKDSGLIPSGSYVIQFLELIEAHINAINKNAKDVDGAESRIANTGPGKMIQNQGRVNAGVGADTYGIVVGTNAGSTAESNENYALDTKILHSAIGEAGKLNYQAVNFITARVVGANVDLDISRPFLNETGNTITVKEIGIICRNTIDNKYHLLLRDVVTAEDVLDGYTLTVIYTLRTTA